MQSVLDRLAKRAVQAVGQKPIDGGAFIDLIKVHDCLTCADDAAVAALRKTQPTLRAFSINGAQKCASDYRLSGLWGNVPASCKNGTMLLMLNDVGYSLWGWPNRFLARMKDAGVHVIIAQDVVDGQIKGLTDVNQYGDIARTFNGYIWVDNIEELGAALKR